MRNNEGLPDAHAVEAPDVVAHPVAKDGPAWNAAERSELGRGEALEEGGEVARAD